MSDVATRLAAALSDRYRIERELGSGGMATVYLAEDLKHHRQVAIKVLREDLAATLGPQRFLREIEITAGLTHPNILPVFDSGVVTSPTTDEARPAPVLYYVMPYVAGESLRERLTHAGALPIAKATHLLREIADALSKAHKAGVIHRDIKPENILLSDDHAFVMDFGVARAVSAATSGQALTTVGVTLGTPEYMAPEQVAADPAADHRVDLYALGLIGYEMLAGTGPFAGATPQQLMAAHVTQHPADLSGRRPDTPAPLVALVMQCLAKSPAERPASAEAVVATLDAMPMTPAGITAPSRASVDPTRLRWMIATACVLAAIVFIAIVLTRHGDAGPTPAEPVAIAVLPLRNEGGDSTQQFFADGMTDEIADMLHQVPGLVVRAHGSTFAFKGQDTIPEQRIGRALDVTRLVEGAVRRHGDALQLNIQLVNAADGSVIDSWQYPSRLADIGAVQDSIAQHIVDRLRLTLTGASLVAVRGERTTNPAAHDAYLQGRFAFWQFTEASLRRSIAYYQQAIALDSTYADPWSGIAASYAWLADEFLPPKQAYTLAKTAALHALALDSNLAVARVNLGVAIAAVDQDYPRAEEQLRRGYDLDSNSVDAVLGYATTECLMRPSAAMVAVARRVVALDPLSPTASWQLTWCMYLNGQYDDAIAQDVHTHALDPDFFYSQSYRGLAYAAKGDDTDAVRAYLADQSRAHLPEAGLAVTYARRGRRADALQIAHALEDSSRHRYVPPEMVGVIFANLGETDSALTWLQRGIDGRSVFVMVLKTWPEYAPIRSDPRFQAMVRRLGLP